MSALDKFLTLCRERESKATKGPWINIDGPIKCIPRENQTSTEPDEKGMVITTCGYDVGQAGEPHQTIAQKCKNNQFITSARTAQPALVEMVEKFQEYLSTDFCICDSDQEYKCDFCELNAAIDLLAEQALREMGEG